MNSRQSNKKMAAAFHALKLIAIHLISLVPADYTVSGGRIPLKIVKNFTAETGLGPERT